MRMTPYARITKTDVERLQAALDRLGALGETIRTSGYKQAPLMLSTLAEVIQDLDRIKCKGAGAIWRDMQRRGLAPVDEQPGQGASSLEESQEPLMRPEVEEGQR